jgi:hypothetical protein
MEVKSAVDAYLLTGIATTTLMKTIHFSRRRHVQSSEKCIILSLKMAITQQYEYLQSNKQSAQRLGFISHIPFLSHKRERQN